MTEEERRRFKSLEALRAAAYASFNDRRSYEWKLSLSIWTALAILLAGLLQPLKSGEEFPLRGSCVWIVFALAGALLVVLHALWSDWASRANSIDNRIQFHFRDEMMNNIVKLPFSTDLARSIEKHLQSRPAFGWTQRSHLVQVCITLLLATGAVVIVYVRST